MTYFLFNPAVIGTLAGMINMSATIPEILANFDDLSRAATQSPWRNVLQLLGNALWLIYGIKLGTRVIVVFSTAGMTFAAIAFIQTCAAQ